MSRLSAPNQKVAIAAKASNVQIESALLTDQIGIVQPASARTYP